MYSPKIYESQIPCLYHAAQSLDVPMTQLANAFVYYGLLSGDFGEDVLTKLPFPDRVLPEGAFPRLQIFNPLDQPFPDYIRSLSAGCIVNPYLERPPIASGVVDPKREVDDGEIPF